MSMPEAATRFLKFVNASPTPFHAVHNAAIQLEKAGFQKVGDSSVQTTWYPNLSDKRKGPMGAIYTTWW